jgi:DNA-binding NtrC family response regulator
MTPLEEAEREQIVQTLKKTDWNQSKAAEILGIDRKTLRMKIRRYGLQDDK